ncbi:YrhK family protein [Paenibacillus faecalis]|uniref:YrhK family protein n=1 Tax=Paenibacillus faecalis TaxID=2079532 RepID=UPI001F209A19|nr:YrhK family protein [Paenibacillus faecalis]
MMSRFKRPFYRKKYNRRFGQSLRYRLLRPLSKEAKRRRRLTVTNRYEAGMVLSEIVTGLFFISGSICMFYSEKRIVPTVLYLIGSITMLLRSGLRASYWFRLKSMEREDSSIDSSGAGEGNWSR